MDSILVFPDIHGRVFWKEGLELRKDGEPIIFLGDYLDPYTGYEDILKEDAYDNFLEILDFAKSDPNTIMLIGNHDWHYFVNLDACRMDLERAREIKKLFIDNLDLFRLTYTIRNCVFSHAGITRGWLNDISGLAENQAMKMNPKNINQDIEITPKYKWISKLSKIKDSKNFELLEESLKNYDDNFYSAPISMISRDRGGWYPHGSLIWADIHEHLYGVPFDFYQIFSHTIWTPGKIVEEDGFWMVDCQRPVRVTFGEDKPKVEVL